MHIDVTNDIAAIGYHTIACVDEFKNTKQAH